MLFRSVFVEFGVVGVILIAAMCIWQQSRGKRGRGLVAAGILALSLQNAAFGGIWALAATLCTLALPHLASAVSLPFGRMKWLFYGIYPVHLVLLGLAVRL